MNNGVQLLTYADRLGGGGLRELRELLTGPLDGLFSGVHVLPFFYPIDGADAGFDPIDHLRVDNRLGDWKDIKALSDICDVTADLIVNHISSESPQFVDYLRNGAASPHAGMFLTVDKVFADGGSDEDFARIYRPRPTSPFVVKLLGDGQEQRLWTTFTAQQIDIDVSDKGARDYLRGILGRLAESGVSTVRLDAVGYAVKTAGTSCFLTPETYEFIDELVSWTHEFGMQALGEIHAYHRHQLEAARHVDYVYDFALPPLILHSLFARDATALRHWLTICPHNAVTVLDTHDGIGVMDVGPDTLQQDGPGLLAPQYIDSMVEMIHLNSAEVSKMASRQDVGNLDLYQVNCTYYDALGRDDRDYLLARLIQFFAPGVPQVYYVGLLAGENDSEQLARTRWGRDVNRRFYSLDGVQHQLQRPVVRSLLDLIRFRNRCPAFDGAFEVLDGHDNSLHVRWEHDTNRAELWINFETRQFTVTHTDGQAVRSLTEFRDFSDA